MWKRIGFSPSPDARLLDFGCGAGERVVEFRRKGYPAFGCDITLPRLPLEPMRGFLDQGIVRPINAAPTAFPFEDESFDMVFSITVFEHVMDYDSALAEIRRVLRPDGISVHLFPSPWKPIETHAFVPFASRMQWYWWLYLWALAGVRNEFQRGYSAEPHGTGQPAIPQERNQLSDQGVRFATTCCGTSTPASSSKRRPFRVRATTSFRRYPTSAAGVSRVVQ